MLRLLFQYCKCFFEIGNALKLNGKAVFLQRAERLFRENTERKAEPFRFLNALCGVGDRPQLSAEPDLTECNDGFRHRLIDDCGKQRQYNG